MSSYRTVQSEYQGKVEKVFVNRGGFVHEWEPLFSIKTAHGSVKKVEISSCGIVEKVNVRTGDIVVADMTLAILKEDQLPSGSD
ncbi:hypothetical protein [Alteribacillus bidgolensis]|uniref:Biotin-requiring enzyme n=1 Tax=Alteribacillus bidgolensis TaxID=930129 RepID=A0A1G8IEQ7_9BACI|nr:hypothetical protein [Alteribacillus bidgolensis]SDI17373.1 hypothetical protein SAMN05216352_105164 [Alteribacillus bidgolensis]